MVQQTAVLQRFDDFIKRANLDPKPYQRDGVRWILANEQNPVPLENVRGGLIADEMGLGKTILMLGTMVSNFRRRTLIVLPLSLLDQWVHEIGRNFGHHALVYHGKHKQKMTFEEIETAPIVVTTYGQIQLTKNNVKGTLLHQIKWDRIIFDEAHHLRTINTNKFRGSKRLKSDIIWLVTGTPIQNRKSDFYALCAMMGYSKTFYANEDNLMTIVKASILKRTKEGVGINLPPKVEATINVLWKNEREKELSEDFHSMLGFSHLNTERGVCGAVCAMANSILPLLIRARQSCIYPGLMKKKIKEFKKSGIMDIDDSLLEATNCSSKIDCVCDTIITKKGNGNAKLVFCHFRGEIDRIVEILQKADMTVEKFDGRTSHSQRGEILNTNYDVLVLQIMTGCEGLNLQHFNEIYFVSPHWNPAVEDQAVARCHRIGQTKPVHIFRFHMGFDDDSSTIDEYATDVQDKKRTIFSLLDPPLDRIKTEIPVPPSPVTLITEVSQDERLAQGLIDAKTRGDFLDLTADATDGGPDDAED